MRLARWGLGFVTLAASALAVEPSRPTERTVPSVPFAATVTFASRHAIPLTGFELADSPAVGDSVTFLLVLERHGDVEQWLVRLTEAELTPEERSAPKPAPAVMYTTNGATLRYDFSPTALDVELSGPFLNGKPGGESIRRARAVVNGYYLRQGIADYCRSAIDISRRVHATGLDLKKVHYLGGSSAPSAAAVASGRKELAPLALTETEERLAFSVYFSLTSFFDAATGIPACRDLLEEVIAKPSVWSLARNLGLRADFNYKWTDAAAVPEGSSRVPFPTYRLPVYLYLNGKPGVKVSMFVATPRPPLQVCAGFACLVLEHPTETDRKLFLSLLAARHRPASQ